MKSFSCKENGGGRGRRESDQKEMYTSNHDRKVRFAELQSIKRQDFRETI